MMVLVRPQEAKSCKPTNCNTSISHTVWSADDQAQLHVFLEFVSIEKFFVVKIYEVGRRKVKPSIIINS